MAFFEDLYSEKRCDAAAIQAILGPTGRKTLRRHIASQLESDFDLDELDDALSSAIGDRRRVRVGCCSSSTRRSGR